MFSFHDGTNIGTTCILEVESLEVLADKGYYNPEEIRKCTENNIIPIIPELKPKQFKEGNVPEPKYYENQFKYDAGKDVYTCPGGRELTFSGESIKNNPDSVKKRNCMSEHPFGTIKRGFNQGYFLAKGLVKVAGEMGLTMLAYNIRRVINILGMNKMMEIMNPG